MDPLNNPFSPGAGSPPPELVGREPIIELSRVLLGRVIAKRSEKSLLLTGLRGVGKTVLLNRIEELAQSLKYKTMNLEAHEDKPLGVLLAPHLRTLLLSLDRIAGIGNLAKRGLAVLSGFVRALRVKMEDVTIGLDLEPELGVADSGDLEVDLPALLVAVGEAAEARKTAVAILIDEIQYFTAKELAALIMAMHKLQQRRLPVVLIGAGLPILPALAGDSKSYAERLFNFPEIGAFDAKETQKALQEPARAVGVEFELPALEEIFRLTQGYPYFVQEWGYQVWNKAASSPIGLKVVKGSTGDVIGRLDRNFFRVRFDRLAPSQKNFLRAMAEIGPGPFRTADIAAQLGVKQATIGPVRAKLLKKGMIYSPAHGEMAYTVPLFDQFMKRAVPELSRRT